jgi:hypothetical protein
LTFTPDSPLDPREAIAELEVRIEELAEALERCRKLAFAAKLAMIAGAVLLAAFVLGFLAFTPMAMLGGVAALLGGIVIYGSNASTAEELTKSLRDAEAHRAALISGLDIRLVHDAPPTLQ